ncbi:MAG: dihydroorotase [Melioribacteraceae bacterium]|nr:dihydroorotase [Melioribacteraceae bacterium]
MKLLLKNLTLIDPSINLNEKTDILIEDGKIKKIGKIETGDEKNTRVIELEGKICAPGFYDMHVHLREPGREDEETVLTGSNAAAAGGFTGVACMPNTTPDIDSAEVVNLIKEKAKKHLVEVNPIGAATLKRKGEELAPIAEMVEAGIVAVSDDGVAIKTSGILKSVLEYTQMYNVPVIEHCEDQSLADGVMNESRISTQLGLPPIPTIAEDLIVMRDISVAEYSGGHVHISHISSKKAVELVRNAKKRGLKISAEATPHHFSLNDEMLKTYDTNYKMNPPLRSKDDVEAVIEGLKDGTIDCIASDHAPHSIEEKEMEFIYAPNGIIGLETELGITLTELYHKKVLTLEQIIEKFSINPRKILKLPIPTIEENKIANLTIFDPVQIWTVDVKKFKSKSKNSPFDKKLLTGKSVAVINKGQMYYENEFMEI